MKLSPRTVTPESQAYFVHNLNTDYLEGCTMDLQRALQMCGGKSYIIGPITLTKYADMVVKQVFNAPVDQIIARLEEVKAS